MKQIRRLLPLLLSLLLLCGCSADTVRQEGLVIYYVRTYQADQDSALQGEAWDGDADIEALFLRLCTTPENEDLSTLIPQKTTLKSWSLEGDVLYLNLSGEYGSLTGIELTMASYCIVLTMCQLEEVSGVSITADGEALMAEEILTPRQVMLDGGEGDTSVLMATLYFPTADGTGIGTEVRTLTISENRTRAESILDALCEGPESRELSAFLPESDQGITLWIKEEICYVNLTEEWQLELESDPDTISQKLICMVNALSQLDEVTSVQFLMDGAALEDWSAIGGDFPLTADFSTVTTE